MSLIRPQSASILAYLGTTIVSLWALTQVDVSNLHNYLYSTFTVAIIVTLPGSIFFAVASAAKATNLRAVKVFIRTVERNSFKVIAREVFPLVVAFFASYASILCYLFTKVGKTSDSIPIELVVLSICLQLSIISFGFLCGLFLPNVFAYSFAALFPLIWSGFTVASNYFPLHYATGLLTPSCCRIYEVIDLNALWLTALWNLGFAISIFGLTAFSLSSSNHRLVVQKSLAIGGVGLILVAGSAFGNHVNPTPQQSRDRTQLECSGSKPEICLYPLQSGSSANLEILTNSWRKLKEIYPTIPSRLVGRFAEVNEISIVMTSTSPADEVVYSLAADAIGTPSYCEESETLAIRRDRDYRLLQNLFLEQVNSSRISVSKWRTELDSEEVKQLTRIKLLPISLKQEWVQKSFEIVKNCSVEPRLP